MKKETYRYQVKDYKFPRSFYVGCITLIYPDGSKQIISLTRVFKNLKILRQYALYVMDDIRKSEAFDASYEGYYLKADFNRLFPLKKKYWSNKGKTKINILQDFRNDEKIIKYWKMSEILVSPDGEINGKVYFSFGTSLFKNTPLCDIELYIKNLNLVVDTQAKNAAFYSLCKPVKISWLEHQSIKNKRIPIGSTKN